jgi:hypothetical protein
MGKRNNGASNYMILSILYILACFALPVYMLYRMNKEKPDDR